MSVSASDGAHEFVVAPELAEVAERLDMPPDELSFWAFVAPDEPFVMVVPHLARRLAVAPDSRAAAVARYLEYGDLGSVPVIG
jgi:hypothetical protein